MGKFLAPKTLSLAFLGEEWKDCYLKFNRLTIKDAESRLGGLMIDPDNPKQVAKGMKAFLSLLEDNFIEGKAVGLDGKVVEVKKTDLGDLPAEVLKKVAGFFTEGLAEKEAPPSGKS